MLLGMRIRPQTNDTLVSNLRALMRDTKMNKPELAKKSRVSERMIGYILAHERKPTVETAEALARAFDLTGWQLIMPGLPIAIVKSGKLDNLVHNYALSSDGSTLTVSPNRNLSTGDHKTLTKSATRRKPAQNAVTGDDSWKFGKNDR